jgi:cell division protein FtsQ
MSLFSRTPKNKSRRTPASGGVLNFGARAASLPAGGGAGLPAGAVLIFGGLSLLVLLWGLWLLLGWFGRILFLENPRFALVKIEAKTDGVLPRDMLAEWAQETQGVSILGRNLFTLSLESLRHNIEKNPIIREATVRRSLPDTLVIDVSERIPIARLGQTDGGRNWLVDAEGIIIHKSFEAKHLPFIKGVTDTLRLGADISGGRAKDALAYLSRLRDMQPVKRELLDIREISVGHPDFLDCRLSDNFRVLLPRNGDVRDALERASRSIYEIKVQTLDKREVDLRPESGNSIISPLEHP